jgi:hypothetical protein
MKSFDGTLQRLQVFAGFEPHGLSRRDVHLRTGSRIPADAGLTRLYREYTKTAQLNPIIRFQGILHAIEYGIDGLLGLGFADTRPLDDLIDKIEFDH